MTDKPTVTDLFNAQTYEEVVALVEQTAVANEVVLTPQMKEKCVEHAEIILEMFRNLYNDKYWIREFEESKKRGFVALKPPMDVIASQESLNLTPEQLEEMRENCKNDWLYITPKEQDEAVKEIAEMLEKAGCERVKIGDNVAKKEE